MFAFFGLGGPEFLILGCLVAVPIIVVIAVMMNRRPGQSRTRDNKDHDF